MLKRSSHREKGIKDTKIETSLMRWVGILKGFWHYNFDDDSYEVIRDYVHWLWMRIDEGL